MTLVLMVTYGIALSFMLAYALVQIHLVWLARRAASRDVALPDEAAPTWPEGQSPFVTIQLPVFNELYVVERLIEATAAISYPQDRFEIQVLNDSTDETTEIVDRTIESLRTSRPGVSIAHVRRPDRAGFKAGALAHGLEIARGELVAVFDADFLPPIDFLVRMVPHFDDPNVGMVQARWGHINENYSLLTRMEAFALNSHFSVEQPGRCEGDVFFNFNGTAGVWRRACIDDAGGWQADTLTEDLDLSYRACLRGWKFHYRHDIECPAELPAQMSAMRSQQFRWTKGGAETARKTLPRILRAKIPLRMKVHAAAHLLNGVNFVSAVVAGVASVPLIALSRHDDHVHTFLQFASICAIGPSSIALVFWTAHRDRFADSIWRRFRWFAGSFPLFVSCAMGMSLQNSVAIFEGLLGIRSPFIRTPKFNLSHNRDDWRTRARYVSSTLTSINVLEAALCLYAIIGIGIAVLAAQYWMIPFYLLQAAGYGLVCFGTLRHARV